MSWTKREHDWAMRDKPGEVQCPAGLPDPKNSEAVWRCVLREGHPGGHIAAGERRWRGPFTADELLKTLESVTQRDGGFTVKAEELTPSLRLLGRSQASVLAEVKQEIINDMRGQLGRDPRLDEVLAEMMNMISSSALALGIEVGLELAGVEP